MTAKILLVDDESNALEGYKRHLKKRFSVDTALSGTDALQLMDREGPFAVIVADMMMPSMDGVELLTKAKAHHPHTIRMMLTGDAGQGTAVDAVNKCGVFKFLNKPCSSRQLADGVDSAVEQYRLLAAERALLQGTVTGVVEVLTDILAAIMPNAFGRALVVREMVGQFGDVFEIEEQWALESAAMLCSIGLVTVPPEILAKQQQNLPLNECEQRVLEELPEVGSRLLRPIPRLEHVCDIIKYSRQNYDGSGAPKDGVAGEDLPIESRLLRVVNEMLDLWDRGLSRPEVLKQLSERPGRFDLRVLETVSRLAMDDGEEFAESMSIKICELQPGHELVSNIETTDGKLLVSSGQKVSGTIIERLRNFARIVELKEPVQVLVTGSKKVTE